jgi:two-component system OmpR family response regulator
MILSEVEIPQLDCAVRARGYALAHGAPPAPAGTEVAAILCRWQDGRAVRAGGVPHIMLAANRTELVAALDSGAADAIAPPVDPDELAARIDLRIRAAGRAALVVGPVTIDPLTRTVVREGMPIALVPREFTLLRYLAERAGQFASRRELLDQVWRLRLDPGTNVVAVHVSNLRAKIDRPFAVPLIQSRRGLGYRLVAS